MYAFINEVNGNKLNQTNEDIATRLECIEWVRLYYIIQYNNIIHSELDLELILFFLAIRLI